MFAKNLKVHGRVFLRLLEASVQMREERFRTMAPASAKA
jgi:hypothetical protein